MLDLARGLLGRWLRITDCEPLA